MNKKRLPLWMKMKLPGGEKYAKIKNLVIEHNLYTICTSGKCPNISECWSRGTATFMISGNICTRACKFCSVINGKPLPLDTSEPANLARAIKILDLKHCVITSVDRDDLPDKGAKHWAECIKEIKKVNHYTTIEALIPDFDGREELIQKVIDAGPEVISHNLETVEQLTPKIRSRAKYQVSLNVVKYIASKRIIAKSGIMLGLGETEQEVLKVMDDLIKTGCSVFTIGQYLAPTLHHLPVREYITPDIFELYRFEALKRGFRHVESHPLVRSSYRAEKHIS